MDTTLIDKAVSKSLFEKNWEQDITNVRIETCSASEDPLGYKAVFYLALESERLQKNKIFSVGASYLMQRAQNLIRAGYQAPMTKKAIGLIEKRIGDSLPCMTAEHLARAV